MSLLKFIVVGAAVGYGINYITKKGPDGKSVLDDLTENAPEWLEKTKQFAEDAFEKIIDDIKPKSSF